MKIIWLLPLIELFLGSRAITKEKWWFANGLIMFGFGLFMISSLIIIYNAP